MRRIESIRVRSRWAKSAALPLVAAAVGLLLTGPARADEDEQRYTELTKFGNQIELGLMWNSDDSVRFGNYTGLDYRGFSFLGNIDMMLRGLAGGDDASYLRMRGLNLGLDSRYGNIELGRQGRFGLFVEFDQLPAYRSQTAATFFVNAGGRDQTLPTGWVPGSNPAAMTELNASLRRKKVRSDRERIGGGFSWVLPANLTFDARYDYETKKGNKLMGATMGLTGGNPRAQILWEPINYETQTFESYLRYVDEDMQLSLGYYGSAFDNNNRHTGWETPYTANAAWDPTAGFMGFNDGGAQDAACVVAPDTCGLGRKGQMPDNWFHQILASGGYNLPHRTRVTLNGAFGWMLQDDNLLPYTVNPNLSVTAALPRSSLDGEIFTTVVDFGISSKPLEKWDFDLGYRFDNRKNNTPRDLYFYVRNDSEDQDTALDSGEARINLPYSYRQHRADFDAGYQIWKRTKLGLGYEFKWTERDFQEVDALMENTLGAILTSQPYSFLSTRMSYEHSWREGDGYVGNRPLIAGHTPEFIAGDLPDCTLAWPASDCPFENHPQLRKSYLANREGDELKFIVTWLPLENLNVSLNLNYVNEDYDDSELGITNMEHVSPGIDVSYTLIDRLTTYAYYNWERSELKQRGLEWVGFGAPPIIFQTTDPDRLWKSKDEDTTNTFGVGFNLKVIPNRLDFGADYLYAKSRERTDIALGPALGAGAPYADNVAKQNNVSVHADYHFTDYLSMRVGYLFADLRQTDWALDGVTASNITPSTGGAVVGTGQRSEGYTNNVVSWSLVYRFW